MDNTVVVSTPPHVKSKRTTRSVMADVCIALLPCAVAGIVYFGVNAFIIELVAVLSCVATEFVYFFIYNKGFTNKCRDAGAVCRRFLHQFDFTSIVSGLILALIVPASVKWYEVLIGSIFTIAVVKMLFGGTGKNIVNPAATGRVFMVLSFAVTMNAVVLPVWFGAISPDSVIPTGATNLSGLLVYKSEIYSEPTLLLKPLDLFLGTGVAGSIGETCKLAIVIGYIYLSVRNVIKWWQPLLFIAVFGLCATLLSGFNFTNYAFDINLFLPHILSGGAMFAAVFMFTDYVTSPKGIYGQLVYYIAGAMLMAVLRFFTGMEIASFVIMILNLVVPLLDKYFIRKPFGYVKTKKQKEGK